MREPGLAPVPRVDVLGVPVSAIDMTMALDAIDTVSELQLETVEDGIRLYRLK